MDHTPSDHTQRMSTQDAHDILRDADLLYDTAAVQEAIGRMAAAITTELAEKNPLAIVVMNGGFFLAGQLLPQLAFPLTVDYVHVTRYGRNTTGGDLTWKAVPTESVAGRDVLVLDDILDVGHTLAAIHGHFLGAGATSVRVAVLTDKETGKEKPIKPDFVGLRLPDRYVFGCGMDVSGAWRNLPAIYAMKGA